ncbi:MAG: class I SAM-dependent rRNA methyltransferase [Bacteroidetes bacterium]|nr:class I SAM-dependent rRNA methyltransferase [Bacteroidota bacterium]
MHPYPSVFLKSGKERAVLRHHPWVFSGAVSRTETESDGAIVCVCNPSGEVLGTGWYNPHSPLRVRLFHFGTEVPRVDAAYWQAKLEAAWQLRETILPLHTPTNAYRLVHAEGDGLPGIILDRYAQAASLQLRSAGPRALLGIVVDFLRSKGITRIAVQEAEDTPPAWLDEALDEVVFEENDVHFAANPLDGQKTGWFLDQRENRALLRRYASGKSVIDCFSYGGGFGLHALAGGATEVTSVDISERAVALCQANHQRNPKLSGKYTTRQADCFQYLRELPAHAADIIVLDPPAFAKSERAVDRAARGYKDIAWLALKALRPGGLLFTFSCSQHVDNYLFRQIAFSAAVDAGRPVQLLHQLHQPPDHPVSIYHPEGEYLKGLVLRAED